MALNYNNLTLTLLLQFSITNFWSFFSFAGLVRLFCVHCKTDVAATNHTHNGEQRT
jgi:hypothetical protein